MIYSVRGKNPRTKQELVEMKRGFTLVELLVVIAIIAIFAAILFPVFAKVRDKARQSTCLSNLRVIGGGLGHYAADFNGAMPPMPGVETGFEAARTSAVWNILYRRADVLHPNNFTCPSDGRFAPKSFQDQDPEMTSSGSYALRDEAFGLLLLQKGAESFPTVIDWQGSAGVWSTATLASRLNEKYVNLTERHNWGFNVLFLDGHVKWHSTPGFLNEISGGRYSLSLTGKPEAERSEPRQLIVQPDGSIIDPKTKEIVGVSSR